MRHIFLCSNCGNELYPRNVGFEEAELMGVALYSKQDIFFTISTCSCTLKIKHDIFKAIDLAVKSIQDKLDVEV